MRALVTGGTGLVGKPLVRTLAAMGHDVSVFARTYDEDRPDGVPMITGDVCDKASLRKAMSGKDVIFHLAACADETDAQMQNVNINGAQNIAELCRGKNIKHLLSMSTAGVAGSVARARENSPYNPRTRYDRAKAAAEKIIRDAGINYTIVRSPTIIGPSLFWNKFFSAVRGGFPVVGDGKNKFHVSYVADVCRLLITVAGNEKAFDHVFNVGTKDVMNYGDFHSAMLASMKVDGQPKHISLRSARLRSRAHAISSAAALKYPEPHMSRQHIESLAMSTSLSLEKAKRVLGFEPLFTTPAAITETLKRL